VAASLAAVDFTLPNAQGVTITQGNVADVCQLGGVQVCPPGVAAFHPLADITPAELITAIITEKGAIAPADLASYASQQP
jgi:methylthioribose-1-phosphate isomerase